MKAPYLLFLRIKNEKQFLVAKQIFQVFYFEE